MRIVVVVVTAWFVCGSAFAFGPAEHETITRNILSILDPATLDELAEAVVAPDDPKGSLLKEPNVHCHNGDFLSADLLSAGGVYPQTQAEAQQALEECRDWIFRSLDRAVAFARPLANPDAANTALDCTFKGRSGSAKCQVLEELGRAFHTTQDFYSHTNWTDVASDGPTTVQNPPGLHDFHAAPFIAWRTGKAEFPAGLISGCFESTPETLHCNYGLFPPRSRVKHAFLSKDTGPIGLSGATGPGATPRGKIKDNFQNDNFQNAVATATWDTRGKYQDFQSRLRGVYGTETGARIACVLRVDDPAMCATEKCVRGDINRESDAVMAACGSLFVAATSSSGGVGRSDSEYFAGMPCNVLLEEMAVIHHEGAAYRRAGVSATAIARYEARYCIGETIMKLRKAEENR